MASRNEEALGRSGGAPAREDAEQGPLEKGPARPDALGELIGRLLARGREEAGKAFRRGKEEIHLRQLRLDRDKMYQKLGKETRALIEAGEVDHPGLAKGVERIREVEAKLREAEDTTRGLGIGGEEAER